MSSSMQIGSISRITETLSQLQSACLNCADHPPAVGTLPHIPSLPISGVPCWLTYYQDGQGVFVECILSCTELFQESLSRTVRATSKKGISSFIPGYARSIFFSIQYVQLKPSCNPLIKTIERLEIREFFRPPFTKERPC